MVVVGAVGQLGLDIDLSASQEDRAHAFAKLVEVLVALRAPAFAELVIFPIEAEERAENCGIKEIDNRTELVNPVFNRGTCQDECVAALKSLDGLGRFCRPIFDPLNTGQSLE